MSRIALYTRLSCDESFIIESPNVLCTKIAKCAINSEQFENKTLREYQNYIRRWASKARGMIPPELDTFQMSLSHEICHLPTDIIDNYLQCAFRSNDKPREFIVVR